MHVTIPASKYYPQPEVRKQLKLTDVDWVLVKYDHQASTPDMNFHSPIIRQV